MIKNFSDILKKMFDSLGGSQLTDFNIGSVTRTMAEAAASAIEELYFYLARFLQLFFISTSTGEWLDKRLGDLGMSRIRGNKAFGTIIVGRDTASPIGISIPAGTTFEDKQGTRFVTLEDGAIPVGYATVEVSAQAVELGAKGNLKPDDRLVQVGIAISGVEWAKVLTMNGGSDDESDESFRARVKPYLRSLGRATEDAIKYAIQTIDGVKGVTLKPNHPSKGWFTVYLDSGTSDALLAEVRRKVDEYRGFTINFSVEKVRRVDVDVAIVVYPLQGRDDILVKLAVKEAIAEYINRLEMGERLYVSALIQTAMNVSGVENVRLTAPIADVEVADNAILKAGTVYVE
ncbi:baseplate J/gp47 family protein [uncultured Phascolarctobacterium sp.]|uniref:baseplate J/gp47 family protein n=1 Tax=uncultured Phascolarctobacterium sp. TaxID=512296 RepID=UPI0026252DF5|nr:baseplate J/gp47 family protein [uncultured Phascolarctobacterium sp.]